MPLPQSLIELVATSPLAHLTTINKDGSPQTTVVWIGIDGDELVTAHMHESQKVRNVRRDPRVSVSFLGPETNDIGLREYAVIAGRVRITVGGAADLLQRLAHGYLGPDVAFPPESVRDRPGFVLHITPERIGGIGPWAG